MPGAGTLLALDVTGGVLQDSPFTSLHLAVQRDITKHLFATASFLKTWRADNAALPLWRNRYGEFGAGWRFTPEWIAQYVLARDPLFGRPQHIIGVRYTFRRQTI
jgi:hypothetical protein